MLMASMLIGLCTLPLILLRETKSLQPFNRLQIMDSTWPELGLSVMVATSPCNTLLDPTMNKFSRLVSHFSMNINHILPDKTSSMYVYMLWYFSFVDSVFLGLKMKGIGFRNSGSKKIRDQAGSEFGEQLWEHGWQETVRRMGKESGTVHKFWRWFFHKSCGQGILQKPHQGKLFFYSFFFVNVILVDRTSFNKIGWVLCRSR